MYFIWPKVSLMHVFNKKFIEKVLICTISFRKPYNNLAKQPCYDAFRKPFNMTLLAK